MAQVDPAYVPTLVWDADGGAVAPGNDSLVWADRTLMWAAEIALAEISGPLYRMQRATGRDMRMQKATGRSLRVQKGFRE